MSALLPVADRWLVTAKLVTESPLAVRSGELLALETVGEEDGGSLALVEADAFGRPYVPGTGLKGALRAWLVQRADGLHGATIEALFGHEPREVEGAEDKQGRGGALEFHDAFVPCGTAQEGAGHGDRLPRLGATAIDPATGSAERRTLRQSELVPAETVFELTVTADNVEPEELGLLRSALDALGKGEITLGANAGTGKGRCRVESLVFRRMNGEAVRDWLTLPHPPFWREQAETLDPVEVLPIKTLPAPELPWLTLHVTLAFDGPFLVSRKPDQTEDQEVSEGAPDRRPVREGYGKSYLPGESLRGALRAQARRIANTLHGLPAEGDHRSVRRLFGARDETKAPRRGALTVSDFTLVEAGPEPERPVQEFVAIDRFTGGAADRKKFAVRHLDRPRLKGRLTLSLRAPRWQQASGKEPGVPGLRAARGLRRQDLGLLALLLRDLAEGDIPLGYGTTKGYGHCRVEALALDPGGWLPARASEPITVDDASPFAEALGPWRAEIAACVARFRRPPPKEEEPAHG